MPRKVFDKVSFEKPRMSAFDLSREHKLSANMGELVPVYVEEILPSDEFQVNTEIMIRLAPMISPVMHRVNVYMHYFFVPNRLVWPEWEDFITGGQEGTSAPTMPTYGAVGATPQGDLGNYLGVPTHGIDTSTIQISALPFRAYAAIWNEYYRDETLQDEIVIDDLEAGNTGISLLHRCWEKDYFTSSLPWPQRGEAVGVPVDFAYNDPMEFKDRDDDSPVLGQNIETTAAGELATATSGPGYIDVLDTEAVDVSINDLRISTALQRWLETQARGGYRYIETILSHFGKRTSDYRLQRPEYLGGGRQPIVISEVLNTSATAEQPQGEMAGHGIAVGNQNRFRREFEEHGYVLGIMSVLPRTSYHQGIERHWTRQEKEDFYWPLFANLGEQEVKNYEVYFDGADDEYNNGTFGYQQRYAEYKYGCSRVSGDFRGNLDFWHIGRKFGSQPSLNESFVRYPDRADAPDKRIFAVDDASDKLWIQCYHEVNARRPMPYFADPRLT